MRSRSTLFALLALLTSAACRDAHDPTSPPAHLAPTHASPVISDGAHGGNPHVFFLPPLVKQPTTSGIFNPSLFPVVRIDRSLDGSSWTPFRTFARSAGEIVIPSGAEHFQVDWNTGEQAVDYVSTYRIQVFGRETPTGPELLLALVDVQFAATGKEARNVSTNEVVGLVDGRTLPIRFRIERNALLAAMEAAGHCGAPGSGECGEVVVRSGVTTPFVLPSGFAAAEFGPDAIHPGVGAVTATIARHNPFTDGPCFPTAVTDLQQAEGCYEYNTDPYLPHGFGRDLQGNGSSALVRVEVCLDRSRNREEFRLFKYSPRRTPQLQELPSVQAPLVKCENFATSPQRITSRGGWLRGLARAGGALLGPLAEAVGVRSLYATDTGEGGMTGSFSPSHIGWGRALAVAVHAGDGQVGDAGSTLRVPPAVSVTAGRSGEGHTPVAAASVPVQWTVTGGGGSVGSATTFTDTAGIASVPWTLGAAAGPNTLSARVPGGATVSFTASAAGALASCAVDPAGGGDLISRGFFHPAYPGSSLSAVDLYFASSVAGDYTLSLTARGGAFDGPVIGTATATVALAGTTSEAKRTRFTFANPAVVTKSTVAFAVAKVSGPQGEVFFNVGGHPFAPQDKGTCPVRQTEDTQPPLSTVRRYGIAVTILGAQ